MVIALIKEVDKTQLSSSSSYLFSDNNIITTISQK